MKTKKVLTLLIAMTLTLSMFTGCATKPSSNATEKPKQKANIRFATWDSDETLTLQQQLVDKFNVENKDVNVVLEGYGNDYDTKIAAGIGANDAPDVMYMWNYPQYGGALEPLDTYIQKEGQPYKDNFYEALWNYNSIKGKVLGMPVGYTTHVVYYNKALFDKAGIPYPTAGWTWQELTETAKKLTNKSEKVFGFAFSGKPDPYDFEMHLWNNGTKYVGDDSKLEGNLNSAKAVETLSMFQNMEKNGVAIASEGSGLDEMKTGKAAMFINGSWSMDTLKTAGIKFGVATLPVFEKGKKSISIISSSGVSISKTSKNKEAAWKFIKYWTSEEANKARIGHEIPVLKSVSKSENLTNDSTYSVFYTMLSQSEGYTPSSFKIDKWSQLSDKLSLVFEQVFNSSTYRNPKEALDEAVK
ncbi:sugar ABC transporter substrate-binding protein [Clostridium sp. CF012]|uniref:ABC transporter substrate-binding protein n=1 Tax=Clostridium sp. CF012 TaxID=2843319 RepID=UPI001C0B26D3|nr:sugar ABC transporter substrate-binding protein [Clostridium sp. CF012]MBU3144853.1 sugar ABC transporter substrate-binding protein [Clostridium sp. CF012]